ncbi:Translation initiation factor eIF-2B subunit beta [Globomyces sp. JEL0801]|nr:Translation initiation factor eIF-2B subunit beta [Globomyces sp. JEL0801]
MLQKEQVPTSVFVVIRPDSVEEDLDKAAELADWPLIIKPSVSYASISITDRSVVETREAALKQINAVIKETNGGVFIESFLAGREFTALCSGDREDGIHVYPVAERVFNKNLKERQHWDGYDLDGSIPTTEEELYWYEKAQEDWQDHLRDIAGRAYLACGGSGYGRVDIRTKNASELNAYVLEVNANCGQLKGSYHVSLETAKLLRNIIAGSRWNDAESLMNLIDTLNKLIGDAQPIEFATTNTIARILHILKDENHLLEKETLESGMELSDISYRDCMKNLIFQAIGELIDEIENATTSISAQASDYIHSNFEGHETAKELSEANIDTAHAVAANGGFIAIGGSKMLASAAKHHSTPVIVCAGLYTLIPSNEAIDYDLCISPSSVIAFENNNDIKGSYCYNPYYDYVKPELLSLFITEMGALPPSEIQRLVYDSFCRPGH